MDDKELQSLLEDRYQGHFYIIRKSRGSIVFYQIPARQMQEFMIMCNPDLLMKKFLSESEAKLKKGDRVVVTHGPLKGLSGRLVRSSGKYYLLKEIPGMAVMMKVTRWCCQKAE
jgi:transcription antitermination factor NusG